MAQKKSGKKASSAKASSKASRSPKKEVTQNSAVAKTAKKTVPTKESAKTPVTDSSTSSKAMSNRAVMLKPKLLKALTWLGVILVTLVVLDYVVQYINNDYSVAIVNGERIPRSEYQERLEEAYGNVIATQMINETLITQEASKEEISATDEEIEGMIAKTQEELGGETELEAALEANGLTIESYRRNLRIQLLAEKLVVEEPTVEDLQNFYDQYKDTYFTDEEIEGEEQLKEKVSEIYRTQKFNELSASWLADLRDRSDFTNNVEEEPSYGFLAVTRHFLSNLNSR